MTDTELVALEKKAKAATPGPWSYKEKVTPSGTFGAKIYVILDFGDWPVAFAETFVGNNTDNASFIAAANPAAILSLIAELRQAQANVAQLKKEADWMAERLHCFCDYNNYCNECALYPSFCQENIERRFEKHVVENWRERAREATEAPCKN